MKKSLVFVLVVFLFASCQTNKNKAVNKPQDSLLNGGITLNGVDEKTALAMMAQFKSIKKNDKHPTTASVWISKEEVGAMVALLDTEIKHETPHKGTGIDSTDDNIGITDGIRIFFACDPNATNLQNTTSILLVSTKDNGISKDISCTSGKRHLNYYDHSPKASLFNMGSIGGLICYGGSSCAGALLYPFICLQCQNDRGCPWSPHNIPVGTARKMVRNFGKDTINTEGEWFDMSMWRTFVKDSQSNGLRIYFATHSKRRNGASVNEADTALRDAFVITPTYYDKKTGTNIDHFDCNKGISYIDSYKKAYVKRLLSPGKDNGELCPNNCD